MNRGMREELERIAGGMIGVNAGLSAIVAAHLDMVRYHGVSWEEMKDKLLLVLCQEHMRLTAVAFDLMLHDPTIATIEVDGVTWHNETARKLIVEHRKAKIKSWQKGRDDE